MRSPVPDNVKNKRLYKRVKEEIWETLKEKGKTWSAYASGRLVREYKKRGGTYLGKKPSKTSGITKWMKEEWVQVVPYLKSGKIVECGSKSKQSKACRPLKRVNSKTPSTIDELVDEHGKELVLKLARKKNRDMDGRLYWDRGTFYPSE